MAASLNATLSIMINAFAAMAKIFLISAAGVFLAKFPSKEPILPAKMIKCLSQLTNNVFVPCLIITSLGSAITVQLLERIGVLVLFCFIANSISYFLGYTIGRLLHGRSDDAMFVALTVAIGSPNAISLPIMVMQTMCDETYVKADYDDNSSKCFVEATSMLFVYSMGWHLMFWSYGFPKLKSIRKRFYPDSSDVSLELANRNSLMTQQGNAFLEYISFHQRKTALYNWLRTIFLTPAMIAIFIGVGIGLIPLVQEMMFQRMSFLRPLGSAITTLGEPVVAVNCLVMSASLAQVDFSIGRQEKYDLPAAKEKTEEHVELTDLERRPSTRESLTIDQPDSYFQKSDSKSITTFLYDKLPTLNLKSNGKNSLYSRLADEDAQVVNDLSNTEKGVSSKVHIMKPTNELDVDSSGVDIQQARNNIECNGEHSSNDGQVEDATSSSLDDNMSSENIKILAITRSTTSSNEEQENTKEIIDHNNNSDISLELSAPTMKIPIGDPMKIPPPTYGSIFALIICRLILPPIMVIFVVIPLALRFNIISGEERLMRLIIAVESCSTSAQVMIISLNQIGIPEVATGLAYMYVFQYIASIFTVTLWITVAVSATYT